MGGFVIFRLRGIHLRENHRVAVVGSSLSLGSWTPKKTCFLKNSCEDTYEVSKSRFPIQLPALRKT